MRPGVSVGHRGVPFSMVHPGNGPSFLQFDLEGDGGFGRVLDAGSTVPNLAVYSACVGWPLSAVATCFLPTTASLSGVPSCHTYKCYV